MRPSCPWAGSSVTVSATGRPTIASPGFLARASTVIETSGLSRKRTVLPIAGGGSGKTTCGGSFSSTVTSVTVLARLLPART